MRISPEHVPRILLIKLRGIGDVLLSTIVIRNLRKAYPDSQIDFLTEPAARDVVSGNDLLNEILVFDKKEMSGLDLIRMVRRRSYSMVIDMFGNPRTALVTRLSGANYRVGYRFRWRSYAYNILTTPRGGLVHNTQFNLDAIENLGIAIHDRELYFPISKNDEEYIGKFFSEKGLIEGVVGAVNVSGGWYTKRWPVERFAEMVNRIVENENTKILITWGPGEEGEAKMLKSMIVRNSFLAPPTTLKQLAALLQQCSFLLTNDNGPMHIAASVGTPVFALYGPTNPSLQGPYGDRHAIVRNESLDCLGCNLTKCPIGHLCMKELQVETVASAFEDFAAEAQLNL